MKENSSDPRSFTRRTFVAGSVSAVIATQLHGAQPTKSNSASRSPLALHGGPKAVAANSAANVRWGEPERVRLNAMLEQKSLFYWQGPQTKALIEGFRRACPIKHVQVCSSGTAALHIAVAAAGIAPGDEVITSPVTDIGTVTGVLFQQAVPVFADLVPDTYNLDPRDVERRISSKTKAIIAVHLCGNPCEMESLRSIADRRGLILIEDCAQAWGARYRGKPVGSVGHFACFSLQDGKHVTCGDGGIVATNDDRFGPMLQPFGDKGIERLNGNGLINLLATNYRMSEPQAAVAAAQMERVEHIASRRAELGDRLSSKLSGLAGVSPHRVRGEDRCVYWFYYFRIDPKAFRCNREEFVSALRAEGVPCRAGYIPVVLQRNPLFLKHGFFGGRWPIREAGLTSVDYSASHTPEAEAILETGVRVTINEAMTGDYIDGVADAIRKVAQYFAA